MKVLMFGWEFPPYISGGLGTACQGLTEALCDLKHDITFVLPKIKGGDVTHHLRMLGADNVARKFIQEDKWVLNEKLKFLQVDSILQPYQNEQIFNEWVENRQKHLTSQKEKSYGLIEVSGDYGRDLITEVVRYSAVGELLVQHEDFEVIHAHDWMTFLAGVRAKEAGSRPLIVHVHSTEFDRSGENVNQAIYDIERYGMDESDQIIAVSHRTKQIIIDRYGQSPDKIKVVHNGVSKESPIDSRTVPKPLKEKVVLFLGRVTMQKGPDYFIEAANLVLKRMKNVRFVMAGVGDMLPRIIERAATLRIQDKFHFTGFLRGNERERVFAISDLYVMPSVSEPFGITPYEVMKYNVPIIVSKQSGIAEVVEHVLKVNFWDVSVLADRIVDVLTDNNLKKQLAENSSVELKNVDWSKPAKKVDELYHQGV